MDLLILNILTIDLILALIILLMGILTIKRQDKKRHDYFLSKKKIRILRDFKELYYSYSVFRTDDFKGIDFLIHDEAAKCLTRNQFFGMENTLFEKLDNSQKYQTFRNKINQLDLLADDFEILYEEKEYLSAQAFIFWYSSLILEIASYKKGFLEGKDNYASSSLSIELKVKNLDNAYDKAYEALILGKKKL